MKYEELVEKVFAGEVKKGSKISWMGYENTILDIEFEELPVRGEGRKIVGYTKEIIAIVFGFRANQRKKFGWVTSDQVRRNVKTLELI